MPSKYLKDGNIEAECACSTFFFRIRRAAPEGRENGAKQGTPDDAHRGSPYTASNFLYGCAAYSPISLQCSTVRLQDRLPGVVSDLMLGAEHELTPLQRLTSLVSAIGQM